MKKSSLITIGILIALVGISIYVFKSKGKSSTINEEASNFKVQDTAAIDKIFLADKEGRSVTLEKTKNGWQLNGKYNVRTDLINTLLYTMKMIEIKSPVAKAGKEKVIKLMAAKSTKVEVYQHGEKIKQYYVGHTTQDHLGTFMILTNLETGENYEDPFITHIPGFEGYLTTRFSSNYIDWRGTMVINYRPPQIKQIKMDLHEIPDSSFVIDLFSMQRFGMKSGKGTPIQFEEDKLKQYIAYFQNLSCEISLEKGNQLIDSLNKSAKPFATLTITDRNDEVNICQFYHKQPIASKNEQYGIDYKYDPDRLFIRYNKGEDYALAQYYVFGKILQTYGYFLPKK